MATGEFNMYDPASVFNKMIQAFYNISMTGETTFVPPVTQFSDANADGWFFTAISYLVHCGFIHGSPDGTLKPNEPITYDEFTAHAANFFNLDINLTREWLEYFDITDVFNPNSPIKRAQAVALLRYYQRRTPSLGAINRYLIENDRIIFPDLQRGFWSFYEVMEAAFTRYHHFDTNYHKIWPSANLNFNILRCSLNSLPVY